MAMGRYGVNDAMAIKLWGKKVAAEALKHTPIAPLIGTSPQSAIHLKDETKKGKGDKVTFALEMQLTGEGVGEGEVQEGNEEALTHYSDSLFINELMHAVRVPNDSTIDAQRVPFKLRESAKNRLRDWWAKRYSVSFFNQVAGNVAQASTKYTGLNSVTAPSSNRQIWTEASVTADESLTSSGLFTLKYLDYAKELAETADVPLQPLMINGEEKWCVYLHPYQVTDLRTDASTAGNWFDIQKAALQGGKVSKNPIYTGALGEYNNIILKQAYDVPQGVNSTTDAAVSNTRRAVFLGAQACSMAFGQKYTEDGFEWVEELFDYQREFGVSAQNIWGMKKNIFNSEDYGVIVISSYAAAHT